jgi:hypothetical protein
MMEAVRTSETLDDNYFTRQYIPEDNSEHHTRRRENLKSHTVKSDSQHYTLDNNRTVKKAFNTKPIGIRKIGRPKLTWEDDVIKDIKTLE